MVAAYDRLLQERLRITFPFRIDLRLIEIVRLAEPKPDTAKVDFLDEALPDIAPLSMRAARFHRGETWPITIIKENFQPAFLAQLSRYNMKNCNTGFYEERSSWIHKDAFM